MGPILAQISLWELAALVVWAILPRWRSVLPRLARPVVAGAETWAARNRVTASALAGPDGCRATTSDGGRSTG